MEKVVVCEPPTQAIKSSEKGDAVREASLDIALLTGGQDRHYAIGLGLGLWGKNVAIEVIGSDEVDGPEFHGKPRVRFLNLHRSQQGASLARRIVRLIAIYTRLFQYAVTAKPKIFHILWNNKLPTLDRTLLMLLYKAVGKKVVLTAHNVNAGRRDKNDSTLNRITLRCQYALSDHIFVHTNKMKDELVTEFDVNRNKITVIPYGVNNAVPFSALTKRSARHALGLRNEEKVILYFGAIKRYKGLENLVAAFQKLSHQGDYRLIIAGERKKGHEEYWQSIREAIERDPSQGKILLKIEFIPDSETEVYFKSADVAVLPYTEIFQSGVLFLAFAYGLPAIAADVGSFSDDIVEGETGLLCNPRDPDGLAATIKRYFETDLYKNLESRRCKIRDATFASHSWNTVADLTKDVYFRLLNRAS